jgi:filamentous hemagglutinin family protein
LPTGGTVASGTATISQTATAQAAAMTVNQSSQRAVVNWDSFNLGSAASIHFAQPNAQAVTLNRVNDSNPSQIFGHISAPGQVFLTNANGVYFSPTSSVDVGALTATTHSISDDNFMSGKYVFERNGASGKVVNEGAITTAPGGYVALLATEVQNSGVVLARAGTVVMAAGEIVTLNVDGNGSLAGITTTPSTIASLIENKLAVQAPGGQIILSATALNQLQAGVIKNSGTLEVSNLVSKGGKIYLEGDDITLASTSKLEAKGATGGGTVLVGGDWQGSGDLRQATRVTMEAGASIDASATGKGDGGKVVLWSDVNNDASLTTVNGSIKSEAGANGGAGGRIETSGHVLNVDGIAISTKSAKGADGEWLLDPYNVYIMKDATTDGEVLTSGTFTPSKTSSYIKSTDLNNALGSANVTVTTGGSTPGTATGNIYVYDGVAWSANKLTLNAWNNIYIYFPMTASSTGSLALQYGQSTTAGSSTAYYIDAPLNLPAGANFSTQQGSTGTVKNFTVITALGTQADATVAPGITTLQGIASSSLTGYYALGSNIDASASQNWTTLVSGYKYFVPIGYGTTKFSGNFEGLGHTISNLKVQYTGTNTSYYTGLFGSIGVTGAFSTAIYNVGLLNESITGYFSSGGLFGRDDNSGITISNIYTSGSIANTQGFVGGIGGTFQSGSVSNVSSSANVSTTYLLSGKTYAVGGIFGYAQANITSSAYYGTLSTNSNVYAGAIQGDGRFNTVTSAFYDSTKNAGLLAIGSNSTVSGTNATPTALTTVQLSTPGNFTGFDFVNVWAMGPSFPMPQFMVTNILRVVPSSASIVYGNTPVATLSYIGLQNSDTAATAFSQLPTATAPANSNVGTQTFSASGGASTQYSVVYDPASVTISRKPLSISGLTPTATKVYNNSTAAVVTGTAALLSAEAKGSGTDTDGKPFTGDTVTVSGTAAATYNSKDVATATTITYSGTGLTLSGASASNYSISYPTAVSGTITAKSLSLTGISGLTLTTSKVYDGTNTATVTGSMSGSLTSGATTSTDGRYYATDSVSLVAGITPTATYSTSNVGTGLTITYSSVSALTGTSAGNYLLTTTGSTAGVISKATLTLSGSQIYNGTTTFLGSSLLATGVAGQTFSMTGNNATLSSANVTLSPVVQSFTGLTLGASSNGGLASNYSSVAATSNLSVSITPAKANLTASKIYDASTSLSSSQLSITGASIGGVAETLGFTGTVSLFDANVVTPNNYVIGNGLSLTNGTGRASNYVLPAFSNSANNSGTVSRATAAVSATKTYDGNINLSNAQVSINGTGSETLGYTGMAAVQSANVTDNAINYISGITALADKTVTVNGNVVTYSASNYQLPSQVVASASNGVTINKANLTSVSATKIYDGLTTVSAAQVDALYGVNSESFSATAGIASISDKNVATANKTLTDLSGLSLISNNGGLVGNYNVNRNLPSAGSNNQVTVSQRGLTLVAASDTKTYDGLNTSVASVVVTNKAATDTVTATQAFASPNALGAGQSTLQVNNVYTIVDSGNVDMRANYVLTTQSVSGTINKANLTAVSASKIYDGLTTVSAGQMGLLLGVNGESFSATAGTASISDKNAATANKTLTDLSGLSLSSGNGGLVGNYNLNRNLPAAGSNNQVTVSQRGLTLLAASDTKTYDGLNSSSASVVVANKAATDTVTATQTFASPNALGAGQSTLQVNNIYTIVDSGNVDMRTNYVLTTQSVSGTINKANLTAVSASKIYDGLTTVTAGQMGLLLGVNGESFSATAGTASISDKNVATVNKTLTDLSGLSLSSGNGGLVGNYNVSSNLPAAGSNNLVSISGANLQVTGVVAQNKTYDATQTAALGGNAAVTALFSDQVNVIGTGTGTFTDKNVGTAKTVTVTGFTFGGTDAGNYNVVQPSGMTADITPATLSISGITASGKTYDGTTAAIISAAGAIKSGLFAGDVVNVAATGSFVDKNAGIGKNVSISSGYSGADVGNYSITDQLSTNATITAAPLTISGLTAQNKTYDGTTTATINTGSAVRTGLIGSDVVTITATGSFADKNVGTGKNVSISSSYSGADAGNYAITDQLSSSANIVAKALGLTIPGATRVYDGSTTISPSGPVTLSGIIGSDQVNIGGGSVTGFVDKNAGTNKTVTYNGLALSGSDASNYTLPLNPTSSATINPATLTISGLTAQNKIYDGGTTATINTASAVKTGIIGNDIVIISTTGSFPDKSVGASKNVSISSTYSGADAGNYAITDQLSTNASITTASLTVVGVTAQNKVYDGSRSATLNGPATVAAFAGDVVTVDAAAATGQFADKNVDTAKVVTVAGFALAGTDAGNYRVVQPSGVLANITAAPLSISGLTAQNKIYDGTTTATINTIGAVKTGLIASDVVTISTTGSFADKNAGGGKLVNLSSSYGGADLGNYNITDQLSTHATITTAPLTISGLTAQDKIYDGSRTATINTAGAVKTGLITNDVVTISVSGSFADKNVGTGKNVSINSSYSGVDAGNYSITDQLATNATITAAPLTISGLIAQGKIYDGSRTAIINSAGAVKTGLIASDVVTISATGSFADKNVGAGKSVSISSAYSGADAGNYSITDQISTSAKITAAPLTLSCLTAQDKIYDGTRTATINTGSAVRTGLIGSDVVTITATGSFADKNAGTSKNVSISSSYSGADAGNYAITDQLSINASITTASLTVVGVTAQNKVYDGSRSATLNGPATVAAFAGDVVTVDAAAATGQFADKSVDTAKAVTVAGFALAGTDAGNYRVVQPSGVLANITAAPLSISGLTAQNKIYDGSTTATINTGSAIRTGLIGSDVVTVMATGSFADKNAGGGKLVNLISSYGGADLGNYNITDQLSTHATITAAPLTISGLTVQDKIYDGTRTAIVNTVGAVKTGLIGNDMVTITATGNFVDKNVGNGKSVSISSSYSGADAGNYSITDQLSTNATITAAPLSISGLTAQDKVYDGTRTATINAAGAVKTGLFGNDVVNVIATGSFADKNVGVGKNVSISSGYSGADVGNYNITDQLSTNATITAAPLAISGLTAQNKTYDGTTTATINTGSAVRTGLISSDVVTITATGSFADKNVGTGKNVSISSSYSGADAGNYAITDQLSSSANIVAKALGLTIPGARRVYDGSTTISPSGPVTLSGIIGSDQVNIGGGSVTGFVDKNAGTNKTVIYNGLALSGSDASNYTLPLNPTSSAVITQAALTISGLTAQDKIYDGTTTATIITAGAVKTGLIGSDVVNVAATGNFADKNVGTGKNVNISSTYSGADAGNYTFTDQISASASITPAPLRISGLTAQNKIYDGTTTATINTTGAIRTGLIVSDVVTIAATGSFVDKEAGIGKSVNISSSYGGADAGNYSITDQRSTSADITARGGSTQSSDRGSSLAGSLTAALTFLSPGGANPVSNVPQLVIGSTADRVLVTVLTPASTQAQGIVKILVPAAMLTLRSNIVIPLGDQLSLASVDPKNLNVTLPNRRPLPSWMRFNAADKTLVVSAVPSGGLPLQILVSAGELRYLVEVMEGNAPLPI